MTGFVLCRRAVPHMVSPHTLEHALAGRWRMLRARQMRESDRLSARLSELHAKMWRHCLERYRERRDALPSDRLREHQQNLAKCRTARPPAG